MKPKERTLQRIKESIRQVDSQAELTLFGSRARNEERFDSDWDLLIPVSDPVGLKEEQKFRHKLFELELELGLAISTFVYSKTDWEGKYRITPLYQSVKKEGVRI